MVIAAQSSHPSAIEIAPSGRSPDPAALLDAVRAITCHLDVAAVQRAIVQQLERVSGARWTVLRRYNPDTGCLELRAKSGAGPVGVRYSIRPDEGLAWEALERQVALYIPDISQEPRLINRNRKLAVGLVSCLVLPLVSEGQSIGILPPGLDAQGRPHHARQYSIASPRNGERPGYNNVSLTVKRVTQDHQGRPVLGVCSNYLCDLKVGDTVQVIGPFGTSFLMPNHPRSNIVMICTGTGSAPMRAMTEWRRRLRKSGKFEGGKLMLFFGARTKEELPYFGPLMSLPKDFIDINLAFSRTPGAPKRYVQDLMRERAPDLGGLLKDPNTYIYVCGLKSMETGVLLALRDVAESSGLSWPTLATALKREGRLHLETY